MQSVLRMDAARRPKRQRRNLPSPSLCCGKVLFWIPDLGTFVGFLKTPVGIIIVIAAAILLIEIPHFREVKKDDEEMQAIIDEIKRLKDEVK